MPYDLSWYIEKRVMMIYLTGHITTEELYEMTDETRVLLEQGEGKVHALVDYSQAESIPRSLSTLVNEIKREKDPKQGITILIMPKTNKMMQFVANIMMQVIGLEFRQVQTMDEALNTLRRVDPTLETVV
ncbi:MAG: hypothetical protein CUN56_12645 [Phototrophicales bacterium]|nr:MAG: hypothetical protein CUN56_12645 [Phototrophicales bacterium]